MRAQRLNLYNLKNLAKVFGPESGERKISTGMFPGLPLIASGGAEGH